MCVKYLVFLIRHKIHSEKTQGEADSTMLHWMGGSGEPNGCTLLLFCAEPLGGAKKSAGVHFLFLFPLTATVEDYISKLKSLLKLDFPSKQQVLNKGRTMPELQGLLQTNRKKVTHSFKRSGTTEKAGDLKELQQEILIFWIRCCYHGYKLTTLSCF